MKYLYDDFLFCTRCVDPNTNSRLPSKRLVENVTLRKLCQEWRDKHKV